jgi:hypothetical protein
MESLDMLMHDSAALEEPGQGAPASDRRSSIAENRHGQRASPLGGLGG